MAAPCKQAPNIALSIATRTLGGSIASFLCLVIPGQSELLALPKQPTSNNELLQGVFPGAASSSALLHEVGQPYQWALDEQKRLIKEKAEAAKAAHLAVKSMCHVCGYSLPECSTNCGRCAGEGSLLHKWTARSEGLKTAKVVFHQICLPLACLSGGRAGHR